MALPKQSGTVTGISPDENIMNMVRRRSVTTRWLTTTYLIIAVVLVITVIAGSILVRDSYYGQAQQIVENQLSVNATYLESAEIKNPSDFFATAQSFVESFESRDTMELQFINAGGSVLVTSSGFAPDLSEEMPDYAEALEKGEGVYVGKNGQKEKICAVSRILTARDGTRIGAVRVVVSLVLVDRAVVFAIAILIGAAVIVLFLVFVSSLYFFRSIVTPVKGITAGASSIAQGDFDIRLKKSQDDEIGDLVDSINSMAAALAENEKLKNDFISSVSHELRTPLTAIKGWGETLRTCGPGDEEIFDKGMNVIINEAGRLSGLVEDLLDFSRLQSGRMKMNFEKLDILAELGEAVYFFSDRAVQEEKTLTFFEAENLPPVMGDRNRLRQVFTNLIDNAMKYSEPGSEIHVTAAQDGEKIRVMIRDFGCGIAPEDLKKVTQKFYKANYTKRGFGIGLGVAQEIINEHGGTIEITSKVGEGTIVTVTLPIAENKTNSNTERK